ncbi:extracellular solute-binding protein [Paenibacillus sp. PAMC21692]|uniref:extracellular solute-binding protein n=1 Tax=Paenibacillus sp. PAMC21692 TaxID=2762320 RepID=UPI00164D2B93|nr:extracellular solute-binding protein [Paenibacillus sp. PAMC21692]QNK60225.1 extracellular solute-binding protein [Paenibacillus sp. PAMC21692]
MNKNKRFTLFLAGGLLITTVLAGCAGNPSSNSNQAGNTNNADHKATDNNKRFEIEVLTDSGGIQLPEGENDRLKMLLDKQLNTDLKLNLFTDYAQVNLRYAGANYPDMVWVNRVSMQEFARKGLLLDLTPYLDKLAPATQFIGEENLNKGMVDGKVYGISKRASIPFFNIWVRKDWLDHLGLPVPTTLEQFFEVAKAFTEDDPDGNNVNDTYGYTGGELGAFDPIYSAFGVGSIGTFYQRDGRLINSMYDPNMPAAIAFITSMINAGVVDPDLLANSGTSAEQRAFQGRVGMIWHGFPRMTHPDRVNEYKAVHPDAEWIQIPALKGPGGEFAGTWDVGTSPGMHAISKSVEKDPEKLQRVFDMLNYMATPEGASLVAHGEEGRHWNREDGKIVRTELRSKEHAFVYQLLGRDEMEYLQSGYPAEAIKFSADTPRIETYNGLLDIPEAFNPADAERYMLEEMAKFLYGKRALGEYSDFLSTLSGTFNYQLMLDSAEKSLKELDIIK